MVPRGKALRKDTKGKTNSTIDFPSNYKASEASVPLEGRRKRRKKKEEKDKLYYS
jgi:hypothetical protein